MARRLRLIDNESGVVEISARTQHGRFLLRPSPDVNAIILGALGRAQAKYSVELYAFVFLSNHFHMLMRADSAHQMAAFVGYFMSKIAKELGRMHGWREKFWGRRYHSASLEDSARVQEQRFFYILRNGCKEDLVESPLEWPGVSTASALCTGEQQLHGLWHDRTAEYQARLRGEPPPAPQREVVRLSPLPFMTSWTSEQRRQYFVDASREVASESRQRHRANGSRPRGVRSIRRQRPRERPKSLARTPAPIFHTSTRVAFDLMKAAREARVAAYRRAAELLRQGKTARFPLGCFPPAAPFVHVLASPG